MRSSCTARGTNNGVISLADFTDQIDAQYLMLVGDFGKRHRQRAAAIAQVLLLADFLRQVQMAERGIGDAGVEHIRGQGFGAADDDAAFGFLRYLAADHVAMAERDDGLAGLAQALRMA